MKNNRPTSMHSTRDAFECLDMLTGYIDDLRGTGVQEDFERALKIGDYLVRNIQRAYFNDSRPWDVLDRYGDISIKEAREAVERWEDSIPELGPTGACLSCWRDLYNDVYGEYCKACYKDKTK